MDLTKFVTDLNLKKMSYDLKLTERSEKFEKISKQICDKVYKKIHYEISSVLTFELNTLHKVLDKDEIEYLTNTLYEQIIGYTDLSGSEFSGIDLKNKLAMIHFHHINDLINKEYSEILTLQSEQRLSQFYESLK